MEKSFFFQNKDFEYFILDPKLGQKSNKTENFFFSQPFFREMCQFQLLKCQDDCLSVNLSISAWLNASHFDFYTHKYENLVLDL